MKDSITIRVAIPGDAAAISEIWVEANSGCGPDISLHEATSYFSGLLGRESEGFRFWVAASDAGKILGWQSLMPLSMTLFERGTMAESSTYTVRRSGVRDLGGRLFSTAIDYAKSSALAYVVGFVESDNKAAGILCKRFSMQPVGRIPASPKVSHCRLTDIYIYTVSA